MKMLASLLLLPSFVCLAAPPIDNRAPLPGEAGYRPEDDAQTPVVLNPPSMIWLHEKGARTYEVQWSAGPEFQDPVSVADLPFNTYTHSRPLAPGSYFWRYRYKTDSGEASSWSKSRRFLIAPGTREFPMPNRAEQRERVPAQHPRLFLRPEQLPRLRAAAAQTNTSAGRAFLALRQQADKLVSAELIPEPTVRGSNRDPLTRSSWWPNRTTTETACRQAEILAFVYLLTGEAKYGEAARKYILHLASWDPDGPTNFGLNCEAAKPLIYRLPRAYDWAYEALTASDREVVRKVMQRRGSDAWRSGEIGQGTGHLNRPYNSHGNRIFHKLGECAIAFLGEIPEAETWLDYAVNKFYSCYPVWSDDDGGWHEGVSYWNGYMSKIVYWLQVAESALLIDGFKKPFFEKVGDFSLYVAPPGSPNQGFGDLSSSEPKGAGFMEYFTRMMSGRPEGRSAPHWQWRNEQLGGGGQEPIFAYLYEANLPPLPAARAPEGLPTSKAFHGIGVASLHVTLTNSAEDVHLLFKSSPFGSQSHGHNAQNGIQLNAYGEQLLVACVYRDWHGSPFHYKWAHSTVSQNAVLVDGQSQVMHSPASRGKITHFETSTGFDVVSGNAVEAYGGKLRRAERTIAFVKPDLIVVWDDLVATNEVNFQVMFQGLSEFELARDDSRMTLTRPKASATLQVLANTPVQFRQWDGYEPKPERNFPSQWHLEVGTAQKSAAASIFTVIVPEKSGAARRWTAERVETGTAAGVRVQLGGATYTVGFRKPEQTGPAMLGGLRFDAPAGWKRE